MFLWGRDSQITRSWNNCNVNAGNALLYNALLSKLKKSEQSQTFEVLHFFHVFVRIHKSQACSSFFPNHVALEFEVSQVQVLITFQSS